MSGLPQQIVRFADLPNRKRTAFSIAPDAPARAAIAEALEIQGLRKLRFSGALLPIGKQDWHLEAALGATAQQACVVTLDPVTTRIDETVTRHYLADVTPPEFTKSDAAEIEMPEDDTTDLLPATLDLVDVMMEALALALPAYPRKDGVETGTAVFTEPGKAPMRDEDTRPFAGLADLRGALAKKDDT